MELLRSSRFVEVHVVEPVAGRASQRAVELAERESKGLARKRIEQTLRKRGESVRFWFLGRIHEPRAVLRGRGFGSPGDGGRERVGLEPVGDGRDELCASLGQEPASGAFASPSE